MTGPGEARTGTLTGLAWRRLDARMLAVFPVKQLEGLIPLLVIVFVGGRDDTAWRVGRAGSALALVGVGGLVHRVLRLSVVEIGTGSQSSSEGRLSLDAVSRAEADRLRRELLDRSTVPDAPDAHRGTAQETADEAAPTADGRIVARLRPSWLRFAR